MGTIPGLSLDVDAAIRAELRPGEELWYAGMPKPWLVARRMLPISVFGLFFGGFAAFWIAMAAVGVWFGTGGAKATPPDTSGNEAVSQAAGFVFLLFPLFGLPFLLVGLAMILSPVWIARMARRTAYCVTSTRAMQITAGRSTRVRSWSPDEIGDIEKRVYADGYGTLRFARSTTLNSKGRERTVAEGFDGTPDPNACEEALLALKEASRSASDPQTAA